MRHSPNLYLISRKPADEPRKGVSIDLPIAGNDEEMWRVLKRANDALQELNTLLEGYAPLWFTQGHHERTEEALHDLNRLIPSCPGLSVERAL
jgi:hypothetical protein